MNLRYLLVIILIYISCGPSKPSIEREGENPERLADQFHEYFSALVKMQQFNGVILVENNGETVIRNAYNLKSDPGNSLFVTESHQFDLRSVSKLIAKLAVLKLEVEGKLTLGDPLEKYIPDFPNADKITIEHLMYNRSGLPRGFADESKNYFAMNTEEIIELIKEVPLEFEPGTDSRYSNLGFQVLYFVIDRVSLRPFAQYVQDEIFDHLDMKSSGAHFYTDNPRLKKFATYHTLKNDSIVIIEHFNNESKKQAKLFSTVDDLDKLLDYLEKPPFADQLVNENGIIGHSGGSEGIRSHIQTNIWKNYSFVFLANFDEIPFSKIIKDIESIIEGKPYDVPQELNRISIELPENKLSKYVGVYDFEEIGHLILEIKIENGKLVVYQDSEFSDILNAENDRLFFWDPKSAESMEFIKDDDGTFKLLLDFKGAKWEGVKVEK